MTDFIVQHEGVPNRHTITTEQLGDLHFNLESWFNLLRMGAGGPPAEMTVVMSGGKRSAMTVSLARAHNETA